MPEVESAA